MTSPVERQPLPRLYSYFTLGLAMIFLAFYFLEEQLKWWQPSSPKILPIVLSGYLALAILNIMNLSSHSRQKIDLYLPSLIAELLILGFLMLYIAPEQNDLGLIMLISVGLGNLIVSQRFGYLLSAIATLMVLSHSYLHKESPASEGFLSGSVLSMLFFIEALIVQSLRIRLQEAQNQVQLNQDQLYSAARMNDLIIERMLTGVCITHNQGQILRINGAAKERLGLEESDLQLPETIFNRLLFWLEYQLQVDDAVIIKDLEGYNQELILSFAAIDEQSSLIFIDDKHSLSKRTNQFKQASLARMAASIAHEIRNPLNAVSHASQLLQESPDLNSDDKRLNEIIFNHSQRMETIIQNVLQISKRKGAEMQWIQLKNWLEHFISEFKKQHPVNINLEGDDYDILFDPSQLHQVIWNLCTNAIRYGHADENNPIDMTLGKHKHNIQLTIKDYGPGIDESELMYLFEPFHTTSVQGSGLGLYLAKELCEANHALIRYDDNPDHGAVFNILFTPSNDT
jgi:two-component system sensor histidine kinase PilS (NtrC family)